MYSVYIVTVVTVQPKTLSEKVKWLEPIFASLFVGIVAGRIVYDGLNIIFEKMSSAQIKFARKKRTRRRHGQGRQKYNLNLSRTTSDGDDDNGNF